MQKQLRSSATIRKIYEGDSAVITVGLEFQPGDFCIKSNYDQPIELIPSAHCHALFESHEKLFQACEGAVHSGVFFANRTCPDQCGTVVLTKLEGINLPNDCGMGFAIAAAIACFHALDQQSAIDQVNMDGWSII